MPVTLFSRKAVESTGEHTEDAVPVAETLAGHSTSTDSRGTSGRDLRGLGSRYLLIVLVTIGVGLRLSQYLINRSLWLDEASLANGLIHKSLPELLRPGILGPVPPGFLAMEKLVISLLGSSEFVLRLFPLVSGLAALALFVVLARRALSGAGAAIAIGLFAVMPYLIYYASEVKNYSSDVAISAALLLIGYNLYTRGLTGRRAASLFLLGVLAVMFALPAVFVLGAIVLTLFAAALHRRERRPAGMLAGVASGWMLLFGLPYLLFLRGISSGGYARWFWQEGFMPLPPRSVADLEWFWIAFVRLFRQVLGLVGYTGSYVGHLYEAGGMLAFVVGVVWLARHRLVLLGFVLGPVLLALLASGLKMYPFGGAVPTAGRVLMFLVPGLILILAAGISRAVSATRLPVRAAGIALLALVLGPPLLEAATLVPYGRTEIRPLLAYVKEHRQPGDLLYVKYDARVQFNYYRERFGFQEQDYVIGACSRLEPRKYIDDIQRYQDHPRVWFLSVNGAGANGFNEEGLIRAYLSIVGTWVDEVSSIGGSLLLVDFRPPPPGGSFSMMIPEFSLSGDVMGCEFWDAI